MYKVYFNKSTSAIQTYINDGVGPVTIFTMNASGAINSIPCTTTSSILNRTWNPISSDEDFCNADTTYYSSLYCANLKAGVALAALALTANRLYAIPFRAPSRGGTINKLEIYTTIGILTGNARIGIYNNSSITSLYPGTLLLDSGAGSVSASVTKLTLSISQSLTPGALYWIALLTDQAITVRSGSTNQAGSILGMTDSSLTAWTTHLYVSQTYGALPSIFPTASPTPGTGGFPAIFYSFSS